MNKYVAVYSWGGIISAVQFGDNLEELIKQMRENCEEERFDGSEDDARIFEEGKPYDCVYSHDGFDLNE